MSVADSAERFLPYGRQAIDDTDIAAVVEVLKGDYLTTGPKVAAFEAALAAKLGARFAVSNSSGTAALHLACLALGLGPGDAAIVPSVTFLATANAVRMVGADVVFADVDPDNGLMRPEDLEAAFARADAAGLKVRAVFPVHLAGQCADMTSLSALARRRGAAVVEDACHAIGAYHACGDGAAAAVGSCRLSDMAILSFHPVKTVAAGEGGAVTTNDPALARRLERLRAHGMVRDGAEFENADMAFDETGRANPWYYEMPEIGWNYRLSDIHAALALSQLERLDGFVETRRALARRYDDLLAPLAPRIEPIRRSRFSMPAWHLYSVLIDFTGAGTERAQVMNRLRAQGIGTQVHYIPVHRQPYYRKLNPGLVLPGAERYYARTLSLPLFVGMTPADVKRIVARLNDAVGVSAVREAS
ncbi:UDP-4-amino-4,6-dideoxy-N-acetyl-beta-L-altrosamine transaminase [Aliidongia dinghuensis]|uniref:UDP-4-amino-4,6-dideoxy-N-acetyl-beta-L-altrosamine transaminase n=1 Tax=Aliidongia dinghuensis TaxID=1867774 RepID=A0A8J3E2I1_9PROT|nr:UDP-4-amino-4,6-dideoxy-N-acetyl-beta-L-altrosamine transaminase [Aliidongia dinghuensis]GGF21460.1 UDP-4-amino-4,6-dideoxy-N-acetyl-beta-L-altrosamine transaminase [Aliidongia dinghuensis]